MGAHDYKLVKYRGEKKCADLDARSCISMSPEGISDSTQKKANCEKKSLSWEVKEKDSDQRAHR